MGYSGKHDDNKMMKYVRGEIVIKLENSWDPIWEKIFLEKEWGKYPEIPLVRFMARNYYNKDRKNIKVLVLGSGCGKDVWYLAREGFDAYAIEGSLEGVRKTNDRLKRNKLKATVEVGDINMINYPDDFFDVVVDLATIQHNPWVNIRDIVGESKRVLKEDGKFFGLMVKEDSSLENNNFGYVHFFTKEEIEDLFKGAKIEYLDYYDDGRKHVSWIVEWINDKRNN